ncbi:testis-expressed protein 13A-like [Acomys russatus]|uniref:testis-expressed protein 13A-like n=1 Tax=Acomys russatus TaxID=60746 RepID=UPI0021E26C66|nr:testis-expressed protein 13A-like [Acomys russatus]
MDPEDQTNGFRHGKVLMFINQQMTKHTKGPKFYLENLSKSWEEVEDKLKAILEDREVPSAAREACAWGSLALGVRFACRQGHLQACRVQWLHDFASLHRSAAHALAIDLKRLADQNQMERKEAAFQLQLAHTKLAQLQRERDLLRLKLLHAVRLPPIPVSAPPSSAPICIFVSTLLTSLQELRASAFAQTSVMTNAPAAAAAAPTTATAAAAPTTAAAAPATATQWGETEAQNAGERKEVTARDTAECGPKKEMDGAIAIAAPKASTVELEGSTLEHLGVVEQENYSLGLKGQAEQEEHVESPTCSVSEPLGPRSITSPPSVTVQLPASFTYPYESPFPVTPTPSPPPSILTEPQMPPYFMATDMNMSEPEGPTVYLQDAPKDCSDFRLQQQRLAALHRHGNWGCHWCKFVNFSWQKTCFHCGRQGWLPSPQWKEEEGLHLDQTGSQLTISQRL